MKHRKKTSKNIYQNEETTISSKTIMRPGTSIRIKCFGEKPLSDDEAIDASFYWRVNSIH
jgi:hypothetical protein